MKYASIDEIMVISVAEKCPIDEIRREFKYLANRPMRIEAGIILPKSTKVFFSITPLPACGAIGTTWVF